MQSRIQPKVGCLRTIGLACFFFVFSCDSSVDGLKSIQAGSGFIPGSKKEDQKGSDLFDEDGNSISLEGGDEGESLFGEDGEPLDGDGGEGADIVFPELDFQAKGFATCDGETRPATAAIITALGDDVLDINMHQNRVDAGSKGQEKADAEMAKSRGHTYYARTPKTKLNELKADGFEYTRFAIFADGVDKSAQQQEYFFDKPLPVYPWPGPETRYSDLDDGPMSWTANVTGHKSFSATIKVTKISSSSSSVELKFELNIAGDTNRALYEDFPIPREATYTINPDTKDIRRIDSVNWHYGDENCKGNQEQVKMTYKLCKKTTGDKVENIPCG